MRHARFIFLILAATLLLHRTANASVVYAWVPDDPNGCCRGVLELSDAAYESGGAAWTPGQPLDGNPVERFHFEGRFKVGAMHPASTASGSDIDLVVSFAATPETARCCAWDFALNVTGTGLAGRLRVTTQNDDVILSGTAAGWTIERAGSDAIASGTICGIGAEIACLNSGGRWVMISGPAVLQKTKAHAPASARADTSFPLR
ncbi:MAG: hypothetical protein AB7I36_11070 [Rhodospirillaceae bacterium]